MSNPDKFLLMTPRFSEWNSKSPLDWKSYQNAIGRFDSFLCSINILQPFFIEYQGMILNTFNIDDLQKSVDKLRKVYSDPQIEYLINHIHIGDLFLNDPDSDTIPIEVYDYIADSIVTMWRLQLTKLFPHKHFVIDIKNRGIDPEVYVIQAPFVGE